MVVTYRYLSPNVLFEPPTTFRAGSPGFVSSGFSHHSCQTNRFTSCEPTADFMPSPPCARIWGASRNGSPNSTRLPARATAANSKPDGTKIEGPAPRPLPHFAITLTADGELQVDKLEIVNSSQVLKV